MTRSRALGWLLVAVQFVLLAILVLGPSDRTWSVPPALRLVGTMVQWIGGGVIVIAAWSLGRAARVHPEPTAQASLRTDGLYRFVRHPIYTGVLLVACGTAATAGTVFDLIVAGALIALLSIKARFEERLLGRRFPAYAVYAKATPRFLPRPGRRVQQSPSANDAAHLSGRSAPGR